MVVIVPVPGWLLLVMLMVGLGLAIAGGLVHRFARKKHAKDLMWFGIGLAGLCGVGFLLGEITG
jgi:hypothetical protein